MTDPVKSVTQLIIDMKLGDADAANDIWERFFGRLCRRLKARVATQGAMIDEEDLALSAMNALFLGAKEGRFQRLDSRDDLWQLLVLIGNRKAANAHRVATNQNELGGNAVQSEKEAHLADDLDRVIAGKVDDSYLDDLGTACRELLEELEPELRELAMLRLKGHSNEEIMQETGLTRRTVERQLMIVREAWKRLGEV